jgi:hypothetical protein
MAELSQGLALDLSYPFAGQAELLTDFCQGTALTIWQVETQA